jgi:hypothetical protein
LYMYYVTFPQASNMCVCCRECLLMLVLQQARSIYLRNVLLCTHARHNIYIYTHTCHLSAQRATADGSVTDGAVHGTVVSCTVHTSNSHVCQAYRVNLLLYCSSTISLILEQSR